MQAGERRIRKAEYVLPIVVGTCAFSLGKKVLCAGGLLQLCSLSVDLGSLYFVAT